MATLQPFRALRPKPSVAAQIAAVPYDVVNTVEARALAEENPLSFLRVSRAEIELPAGTDPYADAVYERAAANFERLKASSLVVEEAPRLYLYRLRMGAAEQTGVAACFSVDEYENDIILKHERTRRDKEDDRTRHVTRLRAQTGPVFLTYRASADVDAVAARVMSEAPLYDFLAADGIHHTIWTVAGADSDAIVSAFARVPVLYIADGHHRAASAARARGVLRAGAGPAKAGPHVPVAAGPAEAGPHVQKGSADAQKGSADADTFLAVAFPHDQVQLLPYNRVVKDLNGLSPAAFIEAVRERFILEPGGPVPGRRGEIAMYFQGEWRVLRPHTAPDATDAVGSLDVSVLQDQLLDPVLGIVDVRTDRRIDFVGGARGTDELRRLVDSGRFAVAFSMFPVSVSDLMAVSDAGAIMPPKSTWFEPKLRDGLLVHTI